MFEYITENIDWVIGIIFFLICVKTYYSLEVTKKTIDSETQIEKTRLYNENKATISANEALVDLKMAELEASLEGQEGGEDMMGLISTFMKIKGGAADSSDISSPSRIPSHYLELLKTPEGRKEAVKMINEIDLNKGEDK